ncbi:hypothetical protein ASPBRDRAFT_45864 [Aspergillus brasiliensis CBS 101740]|uniref:Uncharacterized protein n=1 Tax=Aspergillus brasiliensis (strain CBS 101740 / IMI 381727 / IBT 21946) TaxID=767769 RepID=A0A1L9UCX1_ASPBC|nr:hypothetical protein ASPBRDRAFT_45864 [Aspergillus brasiliensis CBS 101740]
MTALGKRNLKSALPGRGESNLEILGLSGAAYWWLMLFVVCCQLCWRGMWNAHTFGDNKTLEVIYPNSPIHQATLCYASTSLPIIACYSSTRD